MGAELLWLSAASIPVLLALAALRAHSYNLFHATAELFGIFVALTIFAIAWNTRNILANGYFAVLGGAYLFVGVIDALHTLAYRGMGVFAGFDTDLPTQLWLSARYVQAAALVIAPLVIGRAVRIRTVVAVAGAATAGLLGSIFWWDGFPAAFIEGRGLTDFKIWSEYAISAALALALGLTVYRRAYFPGRVFSFMATAIVLTIGSELAFTLYSDPSGTANLVGHFLKIGAFYLTYKALVETTLERPYEVLFRDLMPARRPFAGARAGTGKSRIHCRRRCCGSRTSCRVSSSGTCTARRRWRPESAGTSTTSSAWRTAGWV